MDLDDIEPLDIDIDSNDDKDTTEFKHNIQYIIQTERYIVKNTIINNNKIYNLMKRFDYFFDTCTQIKDYKVEFRGVADKYDMWPKDELEGKKDEMFIIKFNDSNMNLQKEIDDAMLNKLSVLTHTKYTVDIKVSYNFSDNITYTKIKSFVLALFSMYTTATHMLTKTSSQIGRSMYVDGQENKKMGSYLNEDVFKFIYGSIVKKEFSLNKINKEAKDIINKYLESNVVFDVPEYFTWCLKNKFKRGALTNLVKYVSTAKVHLSEDEQTNSLTLMFPKKSLVEVGQIKSMCYYI